MKTTLKRLAIVAGFAALSAVLHFYGISLPIPGLDSTPAPFAQLK